MLPTLARRVRSSVSSSLANLGALTTRVAPTRALPIIGSRPAARDRDVDEPSSAPAPVALSAADTNLESEAETPSDTRAVIVLGGGSDLGIAIAAQLVARGAEAVVLGGRNLEQLREQALEAGIGVRIETVAFDPRVPETHVASVEEAFTQAGEVQAVVVAFGVLGDTPSYEANPALAGGAAVTNFAGAVSTSLAAARALARQEREGTLVVISSIAALRPRPWNYIYGASKAGLDFFARGLAESVRDRGVRVLVVRPGLVERRVRGVRRILGTTPDRVAGDVVEAIEDGASVCWSPRRLRWLDLPIRLMPSVLLRFMHS